MFKDQAATFYHWVCSDVFRCVVVLFLSFFLSFFGYFAFCQAAIVNNNKLLVCLNKDYMDLLYHLVVQIGIA